MGELKSIWSGKFWRDAGERAVKTGLQAALAMLGTGVTGILEVDWLQACSVAAMAAILSLITSVASDPIGERGTASLVK